jgi:CHAT domain-containing protein/tetratricopeptide (TPR) repeat protein
MTFRRAVTAVAIAIAIGGILILAYRRDGRRRLDAALRQTPQRPFQARLAMLVYAPAPHITRSAAAEATQKEQRLRAIASDIATSPGNDDYIRAVAALVANDITGGRQKLEALAARDPGNPAVWSDIAAALSEEAKDNASVLCSALAATDRAIAIDATHATARFNRAVILDALSLGDAAAKAYADYLRVDGTTGWAGEARDRLRVLQSETTKTTQWDVQKELLERAASDKNETFIREVVSAFPQEARTWAEAEFLGEWGARASQGLASAPAMLSLSRSIGAALRDGNGDGLLADAVAAIDAAASSGDRVRWSRLASAHAIYREGRKLYGQRDVARALEKFVEAQRGFESAGSPMRYVVAYYRANADVDGGRSRAAVVALNELAGHVPARYRALHAQLSWLRGTIAGMDGLLELALTSYERATTAFLELGEQQNAMETRTRATAVLTLLGRTAEAWQQRAELFRMAGSAGNAWRLERVLFSAAHDAIREERWDVAAAILSLTNDIDSGNPRLHAESMVWFPLAAKHAGMSQMVQPSLAAARSAPAAMKDARLRDEVTNENRLVEALLIGDQRPAEALELLKTYVAAAERQERTSDLPQVLVERARLFSRTGQDALAERDLRAAIAAIERTRDTMLRNDLRDSFLGKSGTAYDALAELLDARGDALGAVVALDRRRARAMISRAGAEDAAAMQWDAIASLLPRRTAVLTYGMFADRTVLYALSPRGVSRSAVARGRVDVEALVARHVHAIAAADAETLRDTGRELYRLLVEPAADVVGAADAIVFIGETGTERLPFATLVRPDGRFLVESHAVVVAPSIEWYVRGIAHPELGAATSILAVGGPSLDTLRFPDLPSLRGAEREARDAAALYPKRTVLVGDGATKAKFMAALQGREVVHIGAHAVVDPIEPQKSRFLLAGDTNAELTTGELAAMHLDGLRVAVLAGCQSAVPVRGYGDVRSLAAGFLAAGAESVVASLWDLDDEVTRELSMQLHRELRKGNAPPQALRNAQLAMLRSPDTRLQAPRVWAALQLYGGGR